MSTTLQRRIQRLPFISFPREYDDVETGFRRLAGSLFDPTGSAEAVGLFPFVEIAETTEEFTCTAELPGLTQKDVELSFENGMLLIKGEKKDEREIENKRYHVLERAYGSFQRSFTFPASVKSDKISAEFTNGLLTVHLPIAKKPEMEVKKIAITAT
ncbi:MAG TPA: Hsp20/alpha crystallin family protein [Gemmatimonadaceae bacterium]|nr:Hsp20/alpha crystallin family protein [Gemmatimonadaceae bacterium]